MLISHTKIYCNASVLNHVTIQLNERNNYVVHFKGQMELQETVEVWKQKGHIMGYFDDPVQTKPKDFLTNFLQGAPWTILANIYDRILIDVLKINKF